MRASDTRRAEAESDRRRRALPALIALLAAGCAGSDPGDPAAVGARQNAADPTPPTSVPAPPAAMPPPAGPTFSNPLLASGPDPHVVRVDGTYYFTKTSGDRIGLWATTAMSELSRSRYATIFVPPRTGPNSRDLWAPELHRLDGRWYVYYAAGDGSRLGGDPLWSQRTFVLENAGPDPLQGTWVDRGALQGPDRQTWAIDGTVLEHGGRRYFVWSGRTSFGDPDQHLYIAEMANPWTLVGSRVRLSSPDRDWERAGDAGVNEGPQVLRSHAGRVFLVYSANGCWTDDYALGLLALREGGDPLEPADWRKGDAPVFATQPGRGAYGPGHNAFFVSPDGTQDWLVYHANATAGAGCGDARSTRMQPFTWRADGTPEFGVPVDIDTPIEVPSGEARGP